MKRAWWILCGVALALWAGCGDDGTSNEGNNVEPVDINGALVVPAAWAGTWHVTLTFRDCTTDAIIAVEEITSLICHEDTLVNPFAPVFENCTGTRTGNHLDVDCSYANSQGACQVTVDVDFTLDVDGSSLSGNGRVETTATPGCGNVLTASCQKVAIAGTRSSSGTAGCDTLVTARRPFLR